MTSTGFLVIVAVADAWMLSSFWMRKQLLGYKSEIRRLKELSSGMEGHVAASTHLDTLLSAINEAVIRLDSMAKVIAANQRAKELFGIKGDSMPQPLMLFYRDSDWQKQLKRALATLPEKTQLPDIHISGHVLTPRLAQLNDGNALLLCMDITEQYRMDKQRRTFLSNLMHDLKTPLTSLLGYARSMEKFGDDAEFRKEAAQVIADEAKHVNHLLDALLTLDQIELAAQGGEVCEPVLVLKQVCDMLTPQCEAKHLQLVYTSRCDDGLLLPVSDNDLDRVVTNLLSNAVNYSPDGGTIRLNMSQSGAELCIVVEDQGEGIPEKYLSRVTERFYRVDKARTRKDQGHGLGLAIVKELLDKNGGALKLSNLDPHGLRAEITLPVEIDPEA